MTILITAAARIFVWTKPFTTAGFPWGRSSGTKSFQSNVWFKTSEALVYMIWNIFFIRTVPVTVRDNFPPVRISDNLYFIITAIQKGRNSSWILVPALDALTLQRIEGQAFFFVVVVGESKRQQEFTPVAFFHIKSAHVTLDRSFPVETFINFQSLIK